MLNSCLCKETAWSFDVVCGKVWFGSHLFQYDSKLLRRAEEQLCEMRSLLVTLFFPGDLDHDLSLSLKRGSLESCASSPLAVLFCPADSYASVSASHCASTYAVS